MSEERFDHIDNRIRQAAENSEPPFDAAAWQAMELLLDKEDRKRRPFAWWWVVVPFLFLVSAGYLLFYKKPIAAQQLVARNNQALVNETTPVSGGAIPATGAVVASDTTTKTDQLQPVEPEHVQPDKIIAPQQPTATSQSFMYGKMTGVAIAKPLLSGQDQRRSKDKLSTSKKYKRHSKGALKVNIGIVEPLDEDVKPNDTAFADDGNTADPITTVAVSIDDRKDTGILVKNIDSAVDKTSLTAKEANTREKQKLKTDQPSVSKFYFLFAGGIDAAGLKLLSFKNTSLSARYGVSVGYQFNKKIAVQVGFYAGRKKYVAGPADYKIKPGSYWEMVQIQKIDASCLVYEIPVSLRYTFLQKKTTSFFATAGAVSYIMKKEDYKYAYTRYGMPYESAHTYTGNKNLFSVLTFSAGIEQNLSRNFAVFGEPYIGIPLSGVGDGSVKIFSTGLQVGLKYRPGKK